MARLNWSVYQRPKLGETCCGDAYLIKEVNNGAIVVLVDGLGHGEEAAYASRQAVQIIQQFEVWPDASCIQFLHNQLRSTRGVVLGLTILDFLENRLTYWGVGNIQAQVQSQTTTNLISAAGVIGFRLPKLIQQNHPFRLGDRLIMLTDGILNNWQDTKLDSYSFSPSQISTGIGEKYATPDDDATVLVIRRIN
ncbi:MAG: SpoIIE family protein phosphatase [Bacillota bacterium]|jgi:serine/threonine protein phosphatase PrpC